MGTIIAISLVGLGIVGMVFIMVIPSKIPSLKGSIRKSKTVWGLWFTGRGHYELVNRGSSIKRILLMRPHSEAFNRNLEVSGERSEIAASEIKRLTQKALNNGIDVKWYETPRKKSFTLYDKHTGGKPNSLDAYCIVSILKDGAPADARDTYIKKNKGEGKYYFRNSLKEFEQIWEYQSELPKPEEYK